MNDICILLVEDEVGISNITKSYLEKEGYRVVTAYDGEEALLKFKTEDVDLIILDLMLPKLSGEEVIMKIRSHSIVPIIMVTAKVEEDDKIAGLQLGADDYVTKPFSPRELMERVKTVLRRIEKYHLPRADLIEADGGRLRMDLNNNRIYKDGTEIVLTRNEFLILKTLFSNPTKIYTREEIIEISFGIDYGAYDRAIDTHIKNIRQKLEDDPKNPKFIKTVYGLGYKAGGLDEIKK